LEDWADKIPVPAKISSAEKNNLLLRMDLRNKCMGMMFGILNEEN
jgi:hypothetical protein